MSKFSVKQTVTVNIPESFRRDLNDLCGLIESDHGLDFISVIDCIFEAPADEMEWRNWDGSISINFYKDEKEGA